MISTLRHRVANSIRFKNAENSRLWVIIGGTGAWSDENDPPNPSLSATAVNTPIGAKKGLVRWIQPSLSGEFAFVNSANQVFRWTELTTEAAVIAANAHWCLLWAEIVGNESGVIPVTNDFREVGFFTQLTHNQGGSPTAVSAGQITSQGYLETLEYRTATQRQASARIVLTAIIEF